MTSPYIANESAVWLAARRTRLQDYPSRIAMYKDLIEGYLAEAPSHGPPDKDPKPKDTGQPEPWNTILMTIGDVAFNILRVGMTEDAARLQAASLAIVEELTVTTRRGR